MPGFRQIQEITVVLDTLIIIKIEKNDVDRKQGESTFLS